MTRNDASRAADAVDPASTASGFVVDPSAVSSDTASTSTDRLPGAAGPERIELLDALHEAALVADDLHRQHAGQVFENESLRARVATLEASLQAAERLLERVYPMTAHDIPLSLTGRQLLTNIADAEDAAARAAPRGDAAPAVP